jgi:5-(aminomethyl)-3-furanmethanol phosphate kinase
MRRRAGVVVVKLGGSYAGSTDLKAWLEALAGCAGDVVLVPGGGPFADAVRRAQEQMGFDDRVAHHMALAAMEQYGCALLNLGSRMTRAASAPAIRRALRQREIPLWCPSRMVLAADEIPASWDVTADSLAAWLAGKLGAARLLLVKQIRPAGPRVRAADLVAQGLVDAKFPDFLRASGACAAVAGTADHAAAAAAIDNGTLCGTRIDLR